MEFDAASGFSGRPERDSPAYTILSSMREADLESGQNILNCNLDLNALISRVPRIFEGLRLWSSANQWPFGR